MGIIREEVKFEDTEVENELMVDERGEGAIREPGRNISLTVDSMDNWTPKELIAYGDWLRKQGERIERQYDEAGKPKAT